jgi:hypothetical protein
MYIWLSNKPNQVICVILKKKEFFFNVEEYFSFLENAQGKKHFFCRERLFFLNFNLHFTPLLSKTKKIYFKIFMLLVYKGKNCIFISPSLSLSFFYTKNVCENKLKTLMQRSSTKVYVCVCVFFQKKILLKDYLIK